jgi:hypothetical protein
MADKVDFIVGSNAGGYGIEVRDDVRSSFVRVATRLLIAGSSSSRIGVSPPSPPFRGVTSYFID